MNKPVEAPDHCPGVQSSEAGKATACAGCPNQQVCATGETKVEDPAIKLVQDRMSSVKHKIMVLSGKGGVGKSTFSTLLCRSLAALNKQKNVACLDIDICGPSQPHCFGVNEEQVHQSGSGWSPVYVDDNLSVMSIGFLASPNDAIIWRGPKKNGMIRQFMSEVDWGDLDYLVIDTPPGTSDEHLSAATYLSRAGLTGAVIVTTPQELALLDVRKEIDFCRKANINIIGVVENMSHFVCPCCKTQSEIFPSGTGGATEMCKRLGVSLLGQLPIDPLIAKFIDEGKDIVAEGSDLLSVQILHQIAKGIVEYCSM